MNSNEIPKASKRISAREVGGLWIGYYGEYRICGPYMNAGMAKAQTKRYIAKNGAPA